MSSNGKSPILDLQYNQDYPVKILGYKTGENDYGPWHLYQMQYDGKKYSHFAQPNLHLKLQDYHEGEEVTIRKQQTAGDGFDWVVRDQKLQQSQKPMRSPLLDDRTHDIHRQVCLKTAVASFPASDRPWTDEVIAELDRRTNYLMTILDGDTDDDLPF